MPVLKLFRRSSDVTNRTESRFLVRFLVAALLLSPAANGQDAVELDEELEEIIVTGSRIPRDTFSSPSPIQFLYIDEHRQIGVSSVAELLYRAPITNGPQFDATLNTATTTNATEESPPGGVGSASISLRGLAPERTLVLVNGRRLGSVGVRGAPAQPDISMIPFDMIERVDVLTEGVSAVYGADAVAGVVNVILRDQFDGVELRVSAEQPADQGGETRQLSMMFGAIGDRTALTFGAEYYDRERVRTGDRDFTQCLRVVQITPDGERLTVCRGAFPDNVLLLSPDFPHCDPGLFFCPMFYTPDGTTDIDIPNFASWEVAVPDPTVVDPRLEQLGWANLFYFDFYNSQDERRAADLVSELERISVVTTGTIDLDWWTNEQAYFEGYYLNTQVFNTAVTEQIFPSIAGEIPQEDANGNLIVDANGFPVLVLNPLNPFGVTVQPIVTLDSLPQTRDVEREQFRVVAGFRGDIGDSSWSYDGFYSYDRGIGFQAQPILFENHLTLATRTVRLDADGNVVCGVRNINTSAETGFDIPEPCVPLNMFDDDIYTGGPTGEGTFSKAEQDYLIGNRINRTVVEQSILSAYATGDLFSIGDRMVAAAIGAEYRLDEIDSQADITGVQGLIAAENPLQEGETIGERDLIEVFGEINVPLLETLQVDAALRYTDEENFGSETTWRGRISWATLDYLTLSASAGTSFRAPNLREQFLAGQGGGVSGGLDPCDFRNLGQAAGIAGDEDPDFQLLINNCVAQGVAVFDSDGNGFADSSNVLSAGTIATSAGGNPGLQAETSESWTATITFLQPWFDRFDFDIALSYWDIQINNTVEELDAGSIADHCYTNKDFPDGSSPLCSRQTRAIDSDGSADSINFFDISFVNIGEQTARGIDLNTRLHFTFDNWGIDLAWMTAMSWQLEQEIEILGPDDRDDNVGEIGTPEIKFTSSLSLRRNDWEILMHNRFIGDGQQDNPDDFAPCDRWIGAPLCRDVDFVDSVWYTDLSLTYFSDTWSVTLGVNNLFDEDPPLIAWGAGPNRSNAVTSSGYDFFGRSIFATAQLSF